MDSTSVNQVKNYTERIERVVQDYEKSIAQQLSEQYRQSTKWSDQLADKIAAFGGSWKFIIVFSLFLSLWIVLNTINLVTHFDPPPFILLNLLLSFIAAFQAPVIMMSQNRQAARDKHESVIDFAINYKAEMEIDDMQSHLHRIEAQIAELNEKLDRIVLSQ